jgi:hypothetical protein
MQIELHSVRCARRCPVFEPLGEASVLHLRFYRKDINKRYFTQLLIQSTSGEDDQFAHSRISMTGQLQRLASTRDHRPFHWQVFYNETIPWRGQHPSDFSVRAFAL